MVGKNYVRPFKSGLKMADNVNDYDFCKCGLFKHQMILVIKFNYVKLA